MTFIGKILTGMTLVMSILFASLSVVVFATHTNWRDEARKLQENVAKLDAANKRQKEEIEQGKLQLERERLARRMALAALETQFANATDLYTQAQQQASQLDAQIGTLVQKGNIDSAQLAAVTNEVTELRGQLRDSRADRDAQFASALNLTDKVHALEGEKSSLDDQNQQLAAQNARFQRVLEANDLSEFQDVERIPPRVDGVVVAVGERDLIEISLGSDDGLKVGHTLDVYRGSTYLGRVVIQKTLPNKAVAQVIPEFRKGLIRTGDRVATRFVG